MAEEMIDICIEQTKSGNDWNPAELKRLTGKLVVRESVAKFRPSSDWDIDTLPKTLHGKN